MGAQIMEIVVRGRLGPEFIAALSEYAVLTDDSGLTRIVGQITDQARLFGLLDLLERFHIQVISVNPVGSAGPR